CEGKTRVDDIPHEFTLRINLVDNTQ
ncbi:MAG: hypothetical protein RJA48_1381, partial [Verrucomicrobiota bacterium]